MAHVVEDRTTYTDFLKYKYGPAIIQATPEQSVLMKKLQVKAAKLGYGGKSITLAVLYNSMGSFASLEEGDTLPMSLPGNYDNTVIPIDWHYFAIDVSGQAMATSSDTTEAFARAQAQQIAIKTRSYRQHINRQLCGDGEGRLCQMDGAIAGQIATIDNAGGWSGFNGSDSNGHKFITTNMYVQARDSADAAHGTAQKITLYTKGAFPSTSATITLDGTVSAWTDGDYIYVSSGTTTVDSYASESPGVKLLIDDSTVATTVQSIDGSAYPEWNSQVVYGSTRGTAEALTTMRMMNLMSDIQVEGGGRTDFIVTSPAVWLTYGHLCHQNNQIMNAKTYDEGWPTLDFMGTEVWQDPYLPDEMFFIDSSALAIYEAIPPGWMTDDKGGVFRVRSGASTAYDEMEAYWKWYMTLAITDRAKCGKLIDITVTANKF